MLVALSVVDIGPWTRWALVQSARKIMDIPVPTDSLFCLDGITVSRQPTAVGRMACEAWHYSGTCPASKTIFGFHEGSRFIGVIAFRHPNSNPTSLRRYWSRQAMGDENARVSELTRIALLPQSERKWQTTKMMRLAIRAFRMFEPDVDAIYTYADPAENHGRHALSGCWLHIPWPCDWRRGQDAVRG